MQTIDHKEINRLREEDLRGLRKGDYVETRDGQLARVVCGRLKKGPQGSQSILIQVVKVKPSGSVYSKDHTRIALGSLYGQLNDFEFAGRLQAEEELAAEAV